MIPGHALDNPAWHALVGEQREHGIANELAARYRPDISPIVAVADESADALAALAELTDPGEVVALLVCGEPPPSLWSKLSTIQLTQWICEKATPGSQIDYVELGADDAEEMYALAKATDPGPFEHNTHLLGDYIGVRESGELVAMAGERICFAGYREVSAVCTAAGHGGRGYAQALVREIVRREHGLDTVSFLHVRVGSPAEAAAIRVYEKLGFEQRAAYPMHVLRRNAPYGA